MTSQPRITDHRFFTADLFPPGGFAEPKSLTVQDVLADKQAFNATITRAIKGGRLANLITIFIDAFGSISKSSRDFLDKIRQKPDGSPNRQAQYLWEVESGTHDVFNVKGSETPHYVSFAEWMDDLARSAHSRLSGDNPYERYPVKDIDKRIKNFAEEIPDATRGHICGIIRAIERDAVVMMNIFVRFHGDIMKAFGLENDTVESKWLGGHMPTERTKRNSPVEGSNDNHNDMVGEMISDENITEAEMSEGESQYVTIVHRYLDEVCQKIDELLAG